MHCTCYVIDITMSIWHQELRVDRGDKIDISWPKKVEYYKYEKYVHIWKNGWNKESKERERNNQKKKPCNELSNQPSNRLTNKLNN